MARRRRSFFFDNINKRLLTDTTKNTRQSKNEKDAGTTTNTQITTLATVENTISNTNLQDLANVTITTPSNTQILTYNGNIWVNRAAPQGFSGSYNDLTNVPSGLANTLYVDDAVAAIVNSAPTTLNTLDELASALGDDANFATTTATSLGNRLRIDVSNQSLTSTQQTNALTNLGITATVTELNILDGVTANTAELNKLDGVTATTAELNYVDGVTSNIQTQLGNRLRFDDYQTLTTAQKNIAKSNLGLAAVASTGAYSDLSGLPTIPTNNAQLTNGAGYITSSSIPTNNNQLTNGAGYITTTSANNSLVQLGAIQLYNNEKTTYTAAQGLLIYDQAGDNCLNIYNDNLSRWVKIWDDSNDGASSGLDADLLDGQHGSYYSNYNNLSNKPTIPTNNNQLTNGAGYITSSALSSYATSTDLTDGTITKINSQATVGDSIEFFQNDGGGNLGIRFNANYNNAVEDGSAWEFQFDNDVTSGDFLIYYDGSISTAGEAISWTQAFRLDGGDSSLYIFGDKVWDAGNLTNLNQLTNGPGYITSTSASTLTVGDGSSTASHIAIKSADDAVAECLQFYNGTTRVGEIGTEDTTWLRINQETAKNIYTPRYIRADGGFFIDGTSKGLDGSGNLIGGMSVTAGAGSFTSISSSGSITGNDLRSNRYIYAATDTNTYIDMQVSADTIRVVCGGGEVFRVGPNYVEFQDNDTLRLGAGSDFRMWHDGTNNYFRNFNHGGGNIYWQGEDAEGSNHALLYMYTAVSRPYLSFYENGAERMRTTSAGVTTYGTHSASGNICAYSSDARLKTNVVNIENALEKLMSLNGVTFDWKEEVKDLGFNPTIMYNEAGVLAQEVEAVLPQATAPAPFDTEYDVNTGEQISKSGENYLTVQYEKIVPLLIEAMKEQQQQIEDLKEIINGIAK